MGALEALHDVSNALTVVLGWLDELASPDASLESRSRALSIATQKAREARVLAREAIGATVPRDHTRCVADIVAEVVDSLSVEAARAGIAVVVEGDADGAEVLGATALGHVLTNLLLNALAFTPAGSSVHVSLAADARRVEVTVRDQGPGVEQSVVSGLFEGRTSRPGGAGIGLRHARDMTRRLGGDLVFVNGGSVAALEGHPGPGATFRVELPRHRAQLPPSDTTPPPSSQHLRSLVSGARVLVLEDDRAVCALLDAGLGARGVEVVALHDGHDLRGRLSKLGAFDAVLLDLSPIAADLPGAIATVRRALPDAGIVFISGSAVAIDPELANGDRTRWVRKPFEVGEITQAIADLMPAREGRGDGQDPSREPR